MHAGEANRAGNLVTVAIEFGAMRKAIGVPVSYTHLRAHETVLDLVCRLLLENKNHDRRPDMQTLRTVSRINTTTHYICTKQSVSR
mgnify:CR=1 FL=1